MSQQLQIAARIRDNWIAVVQDVHQAAIDAGRDPRTVRVVGVSKYVDAPTTGMLVDAGCLDLGESRPQLLWQKAEWFAASTARSLATEPRWHLIGHLQTNKLRRVLALDPLIHSVDSERLLRAIDQEARRQQRTVDVLLDVNISGDASKTGLAPADAQALLEIPDLSSVNICGLMAMAGWGTDPSAAAVQFRRVAELRETLVRETGRKLDHLSMGMSGDYREAIAAGATLVRIGSALFAGVI